MEQGADPWIKGEGNSTVLHICAERDFTDIAKFFISFDNGKNKDLVYEITDVEEDEDESGTTAMHVACEWHSIEILELLWETGGPRLVSMKNAGGMNCIDYAYAENQEEVYSNLCEKMGIQKPGWIFCTIF
jgi:ankyrin repeat protein